MNRKTILAACLITGLSVASLSSAALAEIHVVKMKFNDATGDLFFEPARLKIQPGDKVVWVHDDADNEHNVAAYPSKIPAGTEPFLSRMLTQPGETWSHTFTKPGSYFYHCHPHEAAGMRGLIVVGRQSLPEEFRRPKPGEMRHDHGGGKMKHGDMMKGEHMMEDGTMMKDSEMMDGDHMMKDGMDHGGGKKHGQAQMKEKMKKKMMEKMTIDDDGHHGGSRHE